MGVEIADPIPPLTRPGWLGRLAERARSGPRWREIAYNLALLPVGVIGYALSMVAWSGSLAMVALPFYVDHLPGSSAKFYFFELTSGPGAHRRGGGRRRRASVRRPVDHARGRPTSRRRWRGDCSVPARTRLSCSRCRASRPAGRRRSTVPRPNGAASSATSTTAPSNGWSRWRPGSAPPARSSTTIPNRRERWSRTPTRRRRRRSRRSATSSAASTR